MPQGPQPQAWCSIFETSGIWGADQGSDSRIASTPLFMAQEASLLHAPPTLPYAPLTLASPATS